MALDNNFMAIQAENNKKDEIISQLRQELGQKNGLPSNFFNPQTPSHNKTAVLQNQSTSIQSHTIPSSGGLGHWNSLHPNKNFNPVSTRSGL